MKVPVDVLKDTFASYNTAAKEGSDQWGKQFFTNAPYGEDGDDYVAGIVTPATHYSMGGVTIDTSARVISTDGQVVSGLYAAGEISGGVHGRNRLGGNALSECVVFGLIAGRTIPVTVPAGQTTGEPASKTEAPAPEPAEPAEPAEPKERVISRAELEAHATEEDCWVALHGKVYDLTEFLDEHPAGPETIFKLAGTDGTKDFSAIHVEDMLADFDFVPLGVLGT